MSAPKIVSNEIDLSTRIPSFPGIYGGILIAAPKGPVGVAVLVTNETQLLQFFTPDETVKVGYDSAFYSALTYLQKSNKLWVVRVANSPLYGGAAICKIAEDSAKLAAGLEDCGDYTFDTECMLITGNTPGAYNNDISVKIYNYTDYADIVKEPGAFILEVYKKGSLVESFTCSREEGKKDGYGTNIYVEDVVAGSNYISVINNPAVADNVLPASHTTAVPLAGGSDGNAVTDADMVSNASALANPNDLYTALLLDGGYTSVAYQKELLKIAENRDDCFAVLSIPYGLIDGANYISAMLEYRKTTLGSNSSYGALYASHIKIYDKYNDRNLYISPDGFAAAAISSTAANYQPWYAPAGWNRGKIDALGLQRVFTPGELDALYDSNINPIIFKPGKGMSIFGQKTLLSRPSSLDRVNVRLLFNIIKPAIRNILDEFLFEFNDDATRAIIRSLVASYMDGIKANKGVYDYEIICDKQNNTDNDIDNHTLNLWLFVKPMQSVETINFSVIVTKTGVDFSVASQLV